MPRFVVQAIWKTLVLGGVVAALTSATISLRFGLAVLIGAMLSAGNFAALAALGRRLLDGVGDEVKRKRIYVWVVLFSLKLGLLLGLALLAVVFLGVDPLGFAVGYTAFLVATGWETYSAFGRPDETNRRSGIDEHR